MPTNQCRSRDRDSHLRCERNARHDGPHRAETGEPSRRTPDGKHTVMPMATWTDIE